MRYLTVAELVAISEREVGPDLLADFGLLESAALRPQTTIGGHDAYPGIHDKAAALVHSIARNHAFIDGNKRTAAIALGVFCVMNGYRLTMSDDELIALILDAAEGQIDVPAIAGVVKAHLVEIPAREGF
ncbi:MAG TPA: type II toxin-antitoxin system death-on-curing family toxin [Acidimicrobiia bacterium]|nr:type II toxin-antitoxin system death-on-curing family toxin [Acidimicrobiia bacterium]